MSTFNCSICGHLKDTINKANPNWNYCKPCWLGYQAQRRLAKNENRNFTMDLYKAWRKAEGLPVNGREVRRGRPVHFDENVAFTCKACRKEMHPDNAFFEDGRSQARVCEKCYQDYTVHKMAIPLLTVKLYIAARLGDLLKPYEKKLQTPQQVALLQQQHRAIRAMTDSMSPLELLDEEVDEMTPKGAEAERLIEE